MILFFVSIILGAFISNVAHILTRSKASPNSPKKFDIRFWWSDNGFKSIASLTLAILLGSVVYFNGVTTADILNDNFQQYHALLDKLLATIIGFCPDTILSILHKTAGFLKPVRSTDSEGKEYDRK